MYLWTYVDKLKKQKTENPNLHLLFVGQEQLPRHQQVIPGGNADSANSQKVRKPQRFAIFNCLVHLR
jgi:hypothetical protein